MNKLFQILNVSSEKQFNNLLEKLDLEPNDLIALEDISNSYKSLSEQKEDVLELMAGTTENNYNIILEQLNKKNEPRKLKENIQEQTNSNLSLNDVMALNTLIENVYKKCQNNKPAAQQIYQMIAKSSSKNIADAFFNFVRNVNNNDDKLKIDTDLMIDNQNLADVIFNLKNNIETLLNSIEEPKKEDINESNENGYSISNRIAGVYDINNNSFNELNKGEEHNLSLQDYNNGKVRYGIQQTPKYGMICYITAIDRGYAYQAMKKIKNHYKDITIDTFNLEFRTDDGKKLFIKLDSNGKQIFENQNIQHFTSEEIHKQLEEEKIKNMNETCTTGSTCSGSIATISKPIKKKKIVKEMNEFPSLKSLIVETDEYRKYAGIINFNNKSISFLPQGSIHSNYMNEDDLQNGLVRFGFTHYKNNIVGYISSDSRKNAMKAIKILNLQPQLENIPIDFWMIEYFEDGQRIRTNIDNFGREIYENANDWYCSMAKISQKVTKNNQINETSLSTKMFIKMIENNINSCQTINENKFKFNNGYLYKNGTLVKTKNINEMIDFILGKSNLPLLEGMLPFQLDILLEEENSNTDINFNDMTPEQRQLKQQQEANLDRKLDTQDNAQVAVEDDSEETLNQNQGTPTIKQNQELVGVDKSDENNKKYIIKNPQNNEISMVDATKIKDME